VVDLTEAGYVIKERTVAATTTASRNTSPWGLDPPGRTKELADLDNPMRTLLGDEPGEGGLLAASTGPESNGKSGPVEGPGSQLPQLPEAAPEQPALDESAQDATATPGPTRTRALPTVAPDPTPGVARSRFDADTGVVYYHEAHTDYLMVKDDEVALLDYLGTVIAAERISARTSNALWALAITGSHRDHIWPLSSGISPCLVRAYVLPSVVREISLNEFPVSAT
jgi:hypothetical protein